MTLTRSRPAAGGVKVADDGGVPARRAVVRWAWRLVRREWRGQVLVVALLTLAVAAAVGGSAAAYNLAPAAGDAEFGSATHRLEFTEVDLEAFSLDLAAARAEFGAVDVIGRRYAHVPGLFDPVELRAQDSDASYGEPMLALVEGRYPSNAGEAAVTDGTAQTLEVGLGETFELGGEVWTTVGTVENPSDLHDEFTLVAPSHGGDPEDVTLLTNAERFDQFRPTSPGVTATTRPANEPVIAAGGVLAAATVVLMLVALIAAAGFVVIARRRLRQLGMLAAIGATERHLRLVMLANGALVGAAAALLGTAIALLVWASTAPGLENLVGHRIDTFNVPWWLVGAGMLLAVVSATAAAWWPARAIAHTPIVSALSGRPDRPRTVHRSATVAGLLVAAGAACLALAGDPLDGWINVALIIVGTAAVMVGVLFFSPLAIRVLARVHAPSVAVRLALSDLARYQARSGTALAAISLALGIATAIVVMASSAMYGAATEGNLSGRQLMIRIGEIPGSGDIATIEERTPAETERLDTMVGNIAASLDATVIDLEVALVPGPDEFEGLPAIVLGEPVEVDNGTAHRSISHLYVASPPLLAKYGVDQDDVMPDTEVLTVETAELWFQPEPNEQVQHAQRLEPGYTSVPGSFITPEALDDRGWGVGRAGWLLESSAPITEDQFADIREQAAAARVTVEARHDQANLATLRTIATGVGALVALGVMAMTVGLIRSEAGGDLRILTAAGATSSNRRTLTAATAGGLALVGALLGMAGAYLGLAAAHVRDLDELTPVPVAHLAVLIVGLPLAAAIGGWLLAGREPGWLARPVE